MVDTAPSNSPGFGWTGRQGKQDSQWGLWLSWPKFNNKAAVSPPWASIPCSGPGLVQQGDEDLQSRQEVHPHTHQHSFKGPIRHVTHDPPLPLVKSYPMEKLAELSPSKSPSHWGRVRDKKLALNLDVV